MSDQRPCLKHEDLIDFVDGTLAANRSREIEAHLAACCACRAYVESVRSALAVVARDSVPEPPQAYWSGFDETVRKRAAAALGKRRRRRWRLVGLLAPTAVLTLTVVGIALNGLYSGRGQAGRGVTAVEPADSDVAVRAGDGGTAGGLSGTVADSLVADLLARVSDDDLVLINTYLAEDDDVLALADGLTREEKQHLISRLTDLMKLKG